MAEQKAYIGLGSNLGDRGSNIAAALEQIASSEKIELLSVSEVIETEPLISSAQPKYLNAVAEIKTTLTAQELFSQTTRIENALGRVRGEKWSPRTIDLDILLFADEIIKTDELTIPHQQMHLRSFVLLGLSQLAPDLRHPVLKQSMLCLKDRLGGGDFVFKPDQLQLISIAGVIGVGKTTLAKKLTELLNAELLLEPYDTNPFMPDVYAGKKELSLDSQLYFLTHRTEQLSRETLRPRQIAVTDYVFEKELIYAKALLDERQLNLYERLYPLAASIVAQPVLTIYLYDSAKICLDRIHSRNRSYEQNIELAFLEKLKNDYDQLFGSWKKSPLIRLQASQLNYTDDSAVKCLAEQIKNYIVV